MIESLLTALVTGSLTLIGVIYTSNKSHEKTIQEVCNSYDLIKQDLNNFKHDVNKDIARLESKQDKHNGLIDRMYRVEKSLEILEERQKTTSEKLTDIEKNNKRPSI